MSVVELQIDFRAHVSAKQIEQVQAIAGKPGLRAQVSDRIILSFTFTSKTTADHIGRRCAALPFVQSWQCHCTKDDGQPATEAHFPARPPAIRVCIVVEGGNVQDVFADGPVTYRVKDFDNITAGDPFEAQFFDAKLYYDREAFDVAVRADAAPRGDGAAPDD